MTADMFARRRAVDESVWRSDPQRKSLIEEFNAAARKECFKWHSEGDELVLLRAAHTCKGIRKDLLAAGWIDTTLTRGSKG